jgi:hypothetical protein
MAMERPDGKMVSNMDSQPYAKSGLPKIEEDDEDLAGVMSPMHGRWESGKAHTQGKEETDALGNGPWELKNDSQVENLRLKTQGG